MGGDRTLGAEVLVDTKPSDPSSLAIGPDGTLYIGDSGDPIVRWTGPGSVERLPLTDLGALKDDIGGAGALAVADDGTVYVGNHDRIIRWDQASGQDEVPVTGVAYIDALALGPDGALYLTDSTSNQVFRRVGGVQTEVPFTGLTKARGLAVGADGSVYVVDQVIKDVVRRAPDGTQSNMGFTGLIAPDAVDVVGDRVYVADAGKVVVQEAGGATTTVMTVGVPDDVVVAADGTVYATSDDDGQCRCPSPYGEVKRWTAAGGAQVLDIGDIGFVNSFVPTDDGSIYFTSYQDVAAYSELNPLRRRKPDGSIVDVSTGSITAPAYVSDLDDGSLCVSTYGGKDRCFRVGPGGSTTEVPVPAKDPTFDLMARDQQGNEAGTDPDADTSDLTEEILVRRPDGSTASYELPPHTQIDHLVGTVEGFVLLTFDYEATEASAQMDLLNPDGTITPLRHLEDTYVEGFNVDRAGNQYLFARVGSTDDDPYLDVFRADGGHDRLNLPHGIGYGGISVRFTADGTMLSGDVAGRILRLTGYALPQTAPGVVAPATPAAPVAGTGSFTG